MAATADIFPVSYKDPQYASLDAATEQKLGLPSGLIAGIRENGEKSNADQVSSAGARTPYQIIPATRDLAIKKWGIDPYISPQNASEVAGLLLKDSLTRNKNDVATAVAEYHGGTDPANWGAKTRAYVQRVVGDTQAAPSQGDAQATGRTMNGVQLPPMQGPSTFDKAMAQMQQEQGPSQLKAVYQAYSSGQMSPEEASQYEADVRSGAMMLPQGATLKGTNGPGTGGATAGGQPVPPQILQAYSGGQMSPQEMVDFEHDVRQGAWQLPNGTTPDALFGPAHKPAGVAERIKNAFTGADRRTATTDALPDWAGMPELNQLSMASAKTGLGTMMSNPQETAQIIQANFPGVQMRQDQKGNFVLRSSVDGKEYAIKPGFQVSDIPRAAAGALAFTPAGRAETLLGSGLAAAGTQAAIEGTQAATGGNFDTKDVLEAGAMGVAAPLAGRVLETAAQPAKALVGRLVGGDRGAALDAEVRQAASGMPAADREAAAAAQQPTGAPGAQAPAEIPQGAAPATVPPTMPAAVPAGAAPAATSVQDIARTGRAAAQGDKAAQQQLAAASAPNPETAAAADRLGISNYLQPDHVTTNDGFRQVVGVLKSNPTSQLALQEKEGLAKVAQRASDLIEEVGGTNDLSTMDAGVKSRMQAAHAEISAREDGLWTKLRNEIPAATETPATNTLEFLQKQAADVGGVENLQPFEKTLLAKLSPKGGENAAMLDALGPAAKQQAMEQGVGAIKQPTYALVDSLRRQAGRMGEMNSAFTDADTGLAKKYYGLLSSDQETVASALGKGDIATAAKAATSVRKGMEDDMSALFGSRLDKSLVPQVSGAMKAAAAGNTAPLLAVLKATPDSMKQEVVASGMGTVFRNAATRGEINFTGYAKWYEGLQRNQQAYTAVMSNLPPAARQQLVDLYRVSKGISDSLNARIKTGLRSSVLQELEGAPDNLASRLFDLAKHAGKGLAVDTVGGHGAGLAMGLMSAIKGNAKPNAVKAIDELLTSPEFQQLASSAGTPKQAEAVRSFAYSKSFTKFARAVGNPRELSNRERWVLQALQARNNMD